MGKIKYLEKKSTNEILEEISNNRNKTSKELYLKVLPLLKESDRKKIEQKLKQAR